MRRSRSSWTRGLKLLFNQFVLVLYESRSSWTRGLKQELRKAIPATMRVAFLVDAWIETGDERIRLTGHLRSRSSWTRGLKQNAQRGHIAQRRSRSSWTRGLKQASAISARRHEEVAFLVDAWIETRQRCGNALGWCKVAFLVDAWIETGELISCMSVTNVAFLVDAWIETKRTTWAYRTATVAFLVDAWIETLVM